MIGFLHFLLVLWNIVEVSSLSLSSTTETKRGDDSPPKLKSFDIDHNIKDFVIIPQSTVAIFIDEKENIVYRSEDEGGTWENIKSIKSDERESFEIVPHPYASGVIFVLGSKLEHFVSQDFGKTWVRFETPEPPNKTDGRQTLAFHEKNANLVLFHAKSCSNEILWLIEDCNTSVYYSTDLFKTNTRMLEDANVCMFAPAEFSKETNQLDSVYCLIDKKESHSWLSLTSNTLLFRSFDWFHTSEHIQPKPEQPMVDVLSILEISHTLYAMVKSASSKDAQLYASSDGKSWELVKFMSTYGGIRQGLYTFLSKKGASLKVDALQEEYSLYGALMKSDEQGLAFSVSLENTNYNKKGEIEYESLNSFPNIALANVVKNVDELSDSDKIINTMITFNDGKSWQPLKMLDEDCETGSSSKSCNLHLIVNGKHRISSTKAPGFLVGTGNVGNALADDTSKYNTYISRDAGKTWKMLHQGSFFVAIGDLGGIIVMIKDSPDPQKKVLYSFDSGSTWEELDLDEEMSPLLLRNVAGNRSQKFLLVAKLEAKDSKSTFRLIQLDFASSNVKVIKKIEDKLFEKVYISPSEDECILGSKMYFYRKKLDKRNYVADQDLQLLPTSDELDLCVCGDEDYECDYGFAQDENGTCTASEPYRPSPEECPPNSKNNKFWAPSGYRKLVGDICQLKGNKKEKDQAVETPCSEIQNPDVKDLNASLFSLPSQLSSFIYMEQSVTSYDKDQTIVIQTEENQFFKSANNGKTWTRILKGDKPVAMEQHPFFNDWLFLFEASKKMHFTSNRGKSFLSRKLPGKPNLKGITSMSFHPEDPRWLLFTANSDCSVDERKCSSTAYMSLDGGSKWTGLVDDVRTCRFLKNRELKEVRNDLILCERFNNSRLNLVMSVDFFENSKTLFTDISDFTVMNNFIAAAQIEGDEDKLNLQTSVDGRMFVPAKFPPLLKTENESLFTILESSTGALFIALGGSDKTMNLNYASILKSNSNGTYFVKSIDYVNQNELGFVDFMKMQGLQGIALVNVFRDPSSHSKALETRITFTDGSYWLPLDPPKKDMDGKWYCSKSKTCSLHLHGFTKLSSEFFTSQTISSAIGLYIGIGNVGEELEQYEKSDTFLTRNTGMTWEMIAKGPHHFEFGDQGSMIVIADAINQVNEIKYSLDYGRTWTTYAFSESAKYKIQGIINSPSSTTSDFIIIAEDAKDSEYKLVHIDLKRLQPRECIMSFDDSSLMDFERWSPVPSNDSPELCFFGQSPYFWRKKQSSTCFIGGKDLFIETTSCECTDIDYECDYNFERATDGSCQLIPGFSPEDRSKECDKEGVFEYTKSTGYRKIPMTGCKGGKQLDAKFTIPCPGKEDLYNKKHKKLGVFSLLAIVFLPLIFSVLVTAGLYRWSKNNGYGQIHLGEFEDPDENIPKTSIYAIKAVQFAAVSGMFIFDKVTSAVRSLMNLFRKDRAYSSAQYSAIQIYDEDEDL